jgi:predicted dehydrogenase
LEDDSVAGIAIIGSGGMGHAHAGAWARLGRRDDIRYVCTPQPDGRLADAPLAVVTADFEAVLRDDEVDLLSVCTPTDTHFELTSRALAAGKHVLLEKPVASTVDEALQLAQIADRHRRILMVAHVVRFFRGYESVLDAVRQGTVGEPYSVHAARLTATTERPAWLQDERRSGGPLVDFAIHDFDQVNLLLGVPRTVRTARAGRHGFETTVDYGGGGRRHVLTSMAMGEGFPFTTSLEVTGSGGIVAYRFSGDERLRGGRSEYEVVNADGPVSAPVDPGDPFLAQVGYFLACAESGRPPERADVRSAALALQVALAAKQSFDTGRAVDLTPFHHD